MLDGFTEGVVVLNFLREGGPVGMGLREALGAADHTVEYETSAREPCSTAGSKDPIGGRGVGDCQYALFSVLSWPFMVPGPASVVVWCPLGL